MSDESVKIESQDLSIESLYKDFYTVPDFQREFVWQREQVEKLLQDIHDEFYDEEGQLIKGPEYFLGSIVVCKDDDGTFHLIDGQQRIRFALGRLVLVLEVEAAIAGLILARLSAVLARLFEVALARPGIAFGSKTFPGRVPLRQTLLVVICCKIT